MLMYCFSLRGCRQVFLCKISRIALSSTFSHKDKLAVNLMKPRHVMLALFLSLSILNLFFLSLNTARIFEFFGILVFISCLVPGRQGFLFI